MIGSTNGKLAYSTVDKVSITLLTDDNAHDKLMGVIVTVSYDDKSTEYIWDGNTIKLKIPTYSEYSISVTSITGYNTPTVFTAIAQMNGETVVDLVYYSVVDLSRVDIYGNPIAQNTANCYVVKEVGTYKLPLVFGNALKNDSINSAAYTKNSGSYSHDFVDFNGTKIASPYIETVSGTVASAQLSIADTDGIFTDISIVDGSPCRYLQFKVNFIPTTGANGVLSIKNSSGVIMWSWHIWVWEDNLTPVEITNATNVKYQILPYNLGSKWDDMTKTTIKNWYYQFGRPTPLLCPAAYNSTSNHDSYGSLWFRISNTASSIQVGIQNPTAFYQYTSSKYNYNWFQTNSSRTYNLWDAACNDTGNSDNNVVKTVYDPCPIGFKIPNGNTFTGFSLSNVVGSFANGWNFMRHSGDTVGVFFPASGNRDCSDGLLKSVGSRSYVWLSSTNSVDSIYFLSFSSNSVIPQHYGSSRANGDSVRPVKDEDLALPTHKLTINVGADNSVLPSGFEIKVYQVSQSTDETTGEVTETLGNVLATQTTASATHEIAWGTTYCVVANDCTGYTTPSNQTFVASQLERSCNVVYEEIKLGVYIQGVNGKLYTETEWNDQETPNGVAILTDKCRFVVAKSDIGTKGWGGYDTDVVTLVNYKDEANAATDFDGINNTSKIIEALGWDNAPGDCAVYTFPNGKTGYLGSAGEWLAASQNKDALNSALTLIGGTKMTQSPYWTSTEYSNNTAWRHLFGSNSIFTGAKSIGIYVRAFLPC